MRWFPGLQATDFDSITAANGLSGSQRYGEFTRSYSAQYGGILLITDGTPADLEEYLYDPLITINSGGFDADSLGNGSQTNIPEPHSAILALVGVAYLFGSRFRTL